MLVGKTNSSTSGKELRDRASEPQILALVFPEVKTLPCIIHSPFRRDVHPSFSLFLDRKGKVRFKDFADSDMSGGLFDLLCKYWECSYPEALTRVEGILHNKEMPDVERTETSPHLSYRELTQYNVQVRTREWEKHDIDYWLSYGITLKWLRYAEVYPISHKIMTLGKKGEEKTFCIPADRYAYCFVERKEGRVGLKIYQPFNKRFKWCSKMDGSVIGLWTKIPHEGDRVVICSSLKDALCVSCQLRIPTLCLQGEGYGMSKTAMDSLKARYKHVFICFDTDRAGIQDAERLAERTGFTSIVPDLGECKDFSDYYKSLDDKEKFLELKKLFM